jgi:peptidoglycan hydrolase-like protein with peptidoglycan-binding domain
MNDVNFSLSVGTVVPERVRFDTVPDVIVSYYPQFRGYDYFVVRDDIVIIDHDRKVVAMMPVGGSSSAQFNTRGSAGGAGRGESVNLSSAEIRNMQEILVREGFDVTVDGNFGAKTRQALMEFQRKNGLQASGRMDNETMTKLGLNEHGGQAGERTTTGQGARGREDERGNTAQGRQNEQGANPSSTAGQSRPQGQRESTEQGGNRPSTTGQGARQGQQNGRQGNSEIRGNEQNRQSGNAPSDNNRRERENAK